MSRYPLLLLFLLALSPLARATLGDALWQPLPERERASRGLAEKPGKAWQLDESALRERLRQADDTGLSEISLPVDGRPQRFAVTPSPILAPGLAARYPELRTYRIRGLDDAAASGRLSMTPRGLGAAFDAGGETRYIDPEDSDGAVYRVQRRSQTSRSEPFSCGVRGEERRRAARPLSSPADIRRAARTPGDLRIYRIAIATTVEYSNAVKRPTSTSDSEIRADVMAEIITLLNRVNQIYERDLAIQLQLVINDDQLISVGDPVLDPFTNDDGEAMLDENQRFIDRIIGSANYDIGHVLSTGGGGIANVGSVCDDSGKAGGVTGLADPRGDLFYIDYVAHEIGHQFGADHSFNGTSGSCSGNRWADQAFEPGSGSTIMSYAGICGAENTSRNALAMFHGGSIEVIDAGTTTGLAAQCGALATASNPSQPTVEAGADRTIPRQTPFRLRAVAADSDGDSLSYAWEEMDLGTATNAQTFGKDFGDNALFRGYDPVSTPDRDFPSLGLTLLGKYDKAEVLPCQQRSLKFRVTVRDGNSGLAQDDLVLQVDGDSGPFEVTSQQTPTTLYPSSPVLVSWNRARTQLPPVNCTSVDISLLSFNSNGIDYGETLLAGNEPNDGQALLNLPDRFAERARFRVACSDNYFYALSRADLRIEGSSANPFPVSGAIAFYNPDASLTAGPEPAGGVCVSADSGNGGGSSGGGSGSSGGGDSGSLPPELLIGLFAIWYLRRRWKPGAC